MKLTLKEIHAVLYIIDLYKRKSSDKVNDDLKSARKKLKKETLKR